MGGDRIKKLAAIVLSLIFVLTLAGCSDSNPIMGSSDIANIKTDVEETQETSVGSSDSNPIMSLSDVAKIEIDVEETQKTVVLQDTEDIKHICDNLNALTLEKMEYNEPTILIYSLRFFNVNGEKIKEIKISIDGWIDYNGYFHSVKEGELDLDYISQLVES